MQSKQDTIIPKLSDHGTVRFEITKTNIDNHKSVIRMAVRNIQSPFGIRVPPAYNPVNDIHYDKYFPPKWDGFDLSDDPATAALELMVIESGLSIQAIQTRLSKNDAAAKKRYQCLLKCVELIRKSPVTTAQKSKQVAEIRSLLGGMNSSDYYALENVKFYEKRISQFFKKMASEKKIILMMQELPREGGVYYEPFLSALKNAGYDERHLVRNDHGSAVVRLIVDEPDPQPLNYGKSTPQVGKVIASLKPVAKELRYQVASSPNDQLILVSFHAKSILVCDQQMGLYTLNQDKLVTLINSLNQLKNIHTNCSIIIAGDLNLPVELAAEFEQLLQQNEISCVTKATRTVAGNQFVTIDIAMLVNPKTGLSPAQLQHDSNFSSDKKKAKQSGLKTFPSPVRTELAETLGRTASGSKEHHEFSEADEALQKALSEKLDRLKKRKNNYYYFGLFKYFGAYSKQEKIKAIEAFQKGDPLDMTSLGALKQGELGDIMKKHCRKLGVTLDQFLNQYVSNTSNNRAKP